MPPAHAPPTETHLEEKSMVTLAMAMDLTRAAGANSGVARKFVIDPHGLLRKSA